jgi:CRISPR-associated protein Csm4
MSNLKIIKLQFVSPLHLSRGKSNLENSYETLHSDTLKSALFVCALQLYGDDEILRGGDGQAFFEAFTNSSAFPYAGDELFFPKPEWLSDSLTQSLELKELKKLKYISWQYYQDLLNGSLTSLETGKIKKRKYYTNSVDFEAPFISETVQRVVVSRDFESDADTFYTDRLYFKKNSGLFFLLKTTNEEWYIKIMAALRLLGSNGIGSDKTVGNGQFEIVESRPFEHAANEDCNKQIALSLYCPKQKEVQDQAFVKGSAYSIVKRGGYVANPEDFDKSTLRKKSVYMFSEGSVFPKQELEGTIVDLKPAEYTMHPVWRDGRALFLPYKLTTNESE